jgi:hypothetical protein
MPIITLKDEIKKGHKIYDSSCTICLDGIDNGELLRRIKLCKHTFHAKCLTDWINVDETCPNCKENLSKKALQEKEKILWEKLGLNIPKKKKIAKGEPSEVEKQRSRPRQTHITNINVGGTDSPTRQPLNPPVQGNLAQNSIITSNSRAGS